MAGFQAHEPLKCHPAILISGKHIKGKHNPNIRMQNNNYFLALRITPSW